MQSAAMGGITGIEMQSGITGIQDCEGQMRRALLGTDQQLNMPVRVHHNVEALLTPVGHSLAERGRAGLQAVGSAGRVLNGAGHGAKHLLWRSEIGGSKGEINQRPLTVLLLIELLGTIGAGKDAVTECLQSSGESHSARPELEPRQWLRACRWNAGAPRDPHRPPPP